MSSIAYFDLDHTLLDGDSDSSFLDYMVEVGVVGDEVLAAKEPIGRAYMAGEPWEDDYRALIARIYRGRPAAPMFELARTHARERALGMAFPGARELIAEQRREHGELMLLTTTNQVVATPLAEGLGLDGVLSTRLVVRDEHFTGAIEGDEFCTGPGKARALLEHCRMRAVDPERCAMFGDGRSDMEALAAVGRPVAVHPNETLARRAAERGWPVLDLSG